MDWEKDYTEALQYAKTAEGMVTNNKVNNETLYHIICLAIEKFTAALAAKVNYIPMHSALGLVFKEIGKKTEIPESFTPEIRFINSFMTYCSLEFREAKAISNDDLNRMNLFLVQLQDFCSQKLHD
jgi:hypothetical protein